MSHKNDTVHLGEDTGALYTAINRHCRQKAVPCQKKKGKQSPSATITPEGQGYFTCFLQLHECESIKAFYTAERDDTCNILFISSCKHSWKHNPDDPRHNRTGPRPETTIPSNMTVPTPLFQA